MKQRSLHVSEVCERDTRSTRRVRAMTTATTTASATMTTTMTQHFTFHSEPRIVRKMCSVDGMQVFPNATTATHDAELWPTPLERPNGEGDALFVEDE